MTIASILYLCHMTTVSLLYLGSITTVSLLYLGHMTTVPMLYCGMAVGHPISVVGSRRRRLDARMTGRMRDSRNTSALTSFTSSTPHS